MARRAPVTRRGILASGSAALLLPHPAMAAPDASEIRRWLSMRIDAQKRGTGMVVGLTERGRRQVVAHGSLARDGRARVDARTVFDVGSITKVFVALVLADMTLKGEVALDAPVDRYLPAVRVPAYDGRRITLADLATHTAGFPLRPTNLVSTNANDAYAGYTLALLDAFVEGFASARAPGSAYEYSNVGYGLLGQALEARAGLSLAELIRRRVTGPLGLGDTAYTPTTQMAARFARGYLADLVPAPPWHEDPLTGTGGLLSTADDLLTFLEACLGWRETSLAPALKMLTEVERPGGMQPASAIGLGWNILRTGSREIVWKNGSVDGFRAFAGYDKTTGLGATALINGSSALGADDIGLHLLGADFPVDLQRPRVRREIAIDGRKLDRLVGRYSYSDGVISFLRDGDRLVGLQESNGQRFDLFPESDHRFFLKVVDADVVFLPGRGDQQATEAVWTQNGQAERGKRLP